MILFDLLLIVGVSFFFYLNTSSLVIRLRYLNPPRASVSLVILSGHLIYVEAHHFLHKIFLFVLKLWRCGVLTWHSKGKETRSKQKPREENDTQQPCLTRRTEEKPSFPYPPQC